MRYNIEGGARDALVDEVDCRGGVAALGVASFVPAAGARDVASALGQSGDVAAIVAIAVLLSAIPVFVGCFLALMLRDAIRGTGKAAVATGKAAVAASRAVNSATQRDPVQPLSGSHSPSPAAPDAPPEPPSTPEEQLAERALAAELARRAVKAISVADMNGYVWDADLRAAALRWAEDEGLSLEDQSALTSDTLASAVQSRGAELTGVSHVRQGQRWVGLRLREGHDGGG